MNDLFRQPQKPEFGTEPHKLVRRLDPPTSVEAACETNTEKWERIVYEAIKSFGPIGCISDDVRKMFEGAPYSTVTARYKALVDKKMIFDTGERRPGCSGRKQRVLRAIEGV